jgi:hypothetical protein
LVRSDHTRGVDNSRAACASIVEGGEDMMRWTVVSLTAMLALMALGVGTQQDSKPTVSKEHQWLKQLEGEWITSSEMILGPDQPPMKGSGTDSSRMLGDHWSISEMKTTVAGTTVTGIMTIGWDAAKKKFIGTWIDSMTDKMWHYEGTLDAAGKKLSLHAQGPSMTDPTKNSNYIDAIEIVDKDTRILTSSIEVEGKGWTTFQTSTTKRKK